MSDDAQWMPELDVGEVPTGRKLPSYTGNAGVLGTIKTLSEADEASLAVARRTWREIDDEDLERLDARNFRHRETGELWVIPNGFTSLFDTTSAQAFAIRGGYIVPLKRADDDENETNVHFGSMASRQT